MDFEANDPSHVKFGKNVYIDTQARLPQFDNGTSLAYRAYNLKDRDKKLIAIVASVENIPRWNCVDSYMGLADTSFIRLVGSGVVLWSLDGKQKYVFMYSGDLGKCLVKDGGFSEHHWRHPDIVQYFIQPMARMFREMSDKSFAHGSIRPSNIYYASNNQNSPVILGDGLSVYAGSTQSPLFLSPSKALADPMGRGVATLKDDIYAFGVSLTLFLRRSDIMEGLSDKEILLKKIELGSYATLIGNERFPASFLDLLKGVLHDDHNSRWGVKEIFAWLDGTRLTPEPLIKKKKANRPITFSGKKYLYAEFLAIDIHKNVNELASIVEDGSLGRWIERSVDYSPLTDRYAKALERSAGSTNKDYLAAQVAMALNPYLPVNYKGVCFTYDGIGALMAQAAMDGKSLEIYKEVISLNILDKAILGVGLPQSEIVSHLKQYDTCRSSIRVTSIGNGIEKCIYILCDGVACLSPKFKGYFINDDTSLVITFENMCKAGGQNPFILDQHLTAFFSVASPNLIGSVSYDLNSSSKDSKVAANLRFMAALQKRTGIKPLPFTAKVFLDSLSGVYKAFHNKKMQSAIKTEVEKAASEGDLLAMAAILNDEASLAKDKKAFQIAATEYTLLEKEYNEYNIKLANKKYYGVESGHDVASVIAWLISTVVTVVVVLSFIHDKGIF